MALVYLWSIISSTVVSKNDFEMNCLLNSFTTLVHDGVVEKRQLNRGKTGSQNSRPDRREGICLVIIFFVFLVLPTPVGYVGNHYQDGQYHIKHNVKHVNFNRLGYRWRIHVGCLRVCNDISEQENE